MCLSRNLTDQRGQSISQYVNLFNKCLIYQQKLQILECDPTGDQNPHNKIRYSHQTNTSVSFMRFPNKHQKSHGRHPNYRTCSPMGENPKTILRAMNVT